MRHIYLAVATAISTAAPAHAGAPRWCDGYTPSRTDTAVRSVKSALAKGPEFDIHLLEAIAQARCDKPNDPERERLFGEWRAEYHKVAASTDADFDELMAYVMRPRAERLKLEKEQCAAVEPERGTDDQMADGEAIARLVDCTTKRGAGGFHDLTWWLDRPEVTEIQRVAIINRCIQKPSWSDDKLRGELAFCWTDLDKLDRAKFDKEIAALKLNDHGRVMAVATFGETKVKAENYIAKYRKLAGKDPSWKRLLDAPQAGADAWFKQREHDRAAYDAVAAFRDKLAAGSKKGVAGCDDKLRPLLVAKMKAKKPAKPEDAAAAVQEPAGYELAAALVQCYSASGKYLEASATHAVFFAHSFKHHRGPRFAGYYATLDALNAIREDQSNFPLDRLGSLPSPGGETQKAREATYGRLQLSSSQGQIAKVRAGSPTATVTFKTVKWKDPSYDCTPTNRIERFDDGGNPIYVQNCKLTGYETKTSTEAPLEVPSEFAAGLKPGQMAMFHADSSGAKRTGIPMAVFADANKNKLLGLYGVFW